MTDSPTDSPTGPAILNAVRASLRLVNCSSELLTTTQLLALKDNLCETLAIVRAQIQSENFGTSSESPQVLGDSFVADDHRVVIDLSDWENASDAENEENKNKDVDTSAANMAEGVYPPHLSPLIGSSQESQVMTGKSNSVRWKSFSNVLVHVLTLLPSVGRITASGSRIELRTLGTFSNMRYMC